MQLKFMALVLLVLGTACSPQTIESLSVKTEVEDSNQALRAGASFNLVISAVNSDGLESAEVHIEALDYHQFFEDLNANRWTISETFEIGPEVKAGEAEIAVTITAQTGVVTEKSIFIEIE